MGEMNQQIKLQEIILGLIGWALASMLAVFILIVLAVILVGFFVWFMGGG